MRYINLLLIIFVLVSCKKKVDEPETTHPSVLNNGMLVLCEGLFQQNNSTISWVDFNTSGIDNTYFQTQNNRGLGDTGNSMKKYGGKIYTLVNVSSTIEVLNASNLKSIKQISMVDGGISKQPRQIIFNNGKAYITCYDGYVDVLDTASLTITNRIKVGENPEGLGISNGKLYVANSGGLNYPDVDSTLSVIDLASSSELLKIKIGKNPGDVIVDSEGDVYAISRGDYGAIPSRMVRVDTQNDVLLETFAFDASGFESHGINFLVYYANPSTGAADVYEFDPLTDTKSASTFMSLSGVTTMYGLHSEYTRNRLYVFDAMNYTNTGYVHVFDASGNYLTKYHVGLNPNAIVHYD